MDSQVELYCATIPGVRLIAAHYWLVVRDSAGIHRFEVWQQPNVRGRSVGHVHYDLMAATMHVGGGPTKLVTTWTGEKAERIKKVLDEAPSCYPYCHTYRYWPGPNSNTFIAWVLRKADIKHNLGWNALGKRFPVP